MKWNVHDKFKDLPVDEETKIKDRKDVKIGDIDALLESWVWEGISAMSVIFVNDDVKDKSDEELMDIVRDLDIFGDNPSITVKRSESGFTFVNFNFES